MPEYFVFGGCLRSELAFPELTETHGRQPDWTLRLGTLPQTDAGAVLSDVQFAPGCRVTMSRGDGWLRYTHSCTGTFEIFAAGKRIIFDPAPGGDMGIARTDFIARVLLHCVDRERVAWLHGSAVRIGSSAVAFLGPSGAGKSTMALALARGGCEHICDDTLPVEPGVESVIWPSDHTIRLRADTRGRLASCAHATRRESDGKFILMDKAFPEGTIPLGSRVPGSGRAPLGAIYLLKPTALPLAGEAVARRRVGPTAAVGALMQHLKLDPVTGPTNPAMLVSQLGAIASSAPTYELTVSRDWARIDEVVEQLLSWHTPAGVSAAAAATLAVPA